MIRAEHTPAVDKKRARLYDVGVGQDTSLSPLMRNAEGESRLRTRHPTSTLKKWSRLVPVFTLLAT